MDTLFSPDMLYSPAMPYSPDMLYSPVMHCSIVWSCSKDRGREGRWRKRGWGAALIFAFRSAH